MGTNPGKCFGKYQVLAEIGRGGMSRVYLAVARGPGGFSKLVVIKQLSAELRGDQSYVQMFLDEARLAARLNHPNIVQTNEVDQDGDDHYLVMEYLDGQTLSAILRRTRETGGLPLDFIVRIVADAAAGLHYAHTLTDFDGSSLGIVHRDVSPQNIFITYGGQVKIVDFGIAKTRTGSVQTERGVLKGKLAYMAPEQAQGLGIDGRADVFALGIVLHESLTGQRPRDGEDIALLRELLANKPLPSPKLTRADIPDELATICRRAVMMDPKRRYETALSLERDLEVFLGGLTHRVSAHELGDYVAGLFAEKKSDITRIIDGQLRAVEGLPQGQPLSQTIPTLKLSGIAPTPSSHHKLPGPEKDSAAASVASVARVSAPPRRNRGRLAMGIGAVILALTVASTVIALRGNREPRETGAGTNTGVDTATREEAPRAPASEPTPVPATNRGEAEVLRVSDSAQPRDEVTPQPPPTVTANEESPPVRPTPPPKARPAPAPERAEPKDVDPLGDRK